MASAKTTISQSPLVIRQIDQTDPNNIYLGYAKPGTANATSEWQIQKITTTGGVITILFASGTAAFDKVWNSRASYSYS